MLRAVNSRRQTVAARTTIVPQPAKPGRADPVREMFMVPSGWLPVMIP